MAQLATTQANNREQLVTQQQKLTDLLANLNQIIGEKGEQTLLEAISQQRWYGFKNKREIVFDSYTGYLFPNFEYMPHISFSSWEKEKKKYAPNDIAKGLWTSIDTVFQRYDEHKFYDYDESSFSFPIEFSGKNNVHMFLYDKGGNYNNVCFSNFNKNGNLKNDAKAHIEDYIKVFPLFRILNNDHLQPEYSRLTANEKAKIIFDYFLEQDWIPNFKLHPIPVYFDSGNILGRMLMLGRSSNFSGKVKILESSEFDDIEDQEEHQERFTKAQKQCDEYNRIFDAYYQRIHLQKQLVELDAQISELPEPEIEPENQFTSDFDYRQEIQNYNLTEINTSVWQYSLSAQQWINDLLNQIDTWESNHQHLLANALELNTTLAKKLPISLNLNDAEQELFNHRHLTLQQRLNFSLEPLRSALIDLLQQNQQIETTLQNTHALTTLAELEQQPRPTFILLAEHTATLCTQTLKKLEWLENSLDFVQAIVKSKQQTTESYLILLDKYQQDLFQIGLDASIESEDVAKWFAEWRRERLQILQQWQPLIQAGLNGVISEQTVLNVLQCLAQYQQNLDKFYLEKRLGIHTTYAFVPNGHRQEKLEKEQEFTKLIHQFMQNLEKVIFASQNTAQKIWLVRFSEVWQQGIVQEIIKFLANEKLLDRSDIAQIISEEMRKIQQQNLAACLQDANSYSQALAQRDKDFGTLMFKMRKALQK